MIYRLGKRTIIDNTYTVLYPIILTGYEPGLTLQSTITTLSASADLPSRFQAPHPCLPLLSLNFSVFTTSQTWHPRTSPANTATPLSSTSRTTIHGRTPSPYTSGQRTPSRSYLETRVHRLRMPRSTSGRAIRDAAARRCRCCTPRPTNRSAMSLTSSLISTQPRSRCSSTNNAIRQPLLLADLQPEGSSCSPP